MANIFVLVNGTMSRFFQSLKSLRQGNPLSPYLFILATKALNQMLTRAKGRGFILGFKVGKRDEEGMEVFHLLFIDDTMILYDANQDHLRYLSWVFMWFEAIFGLKINLDKIQVIPIKGVANVKELASMLDCRIGKLLATYLGLPFGVSYKSFRVQDGVEERFWEKPSKVEKAYLSKGGRLTLIKSTLSSLPIYVMSMFIIP